MLWVSGLRSQWLSGKSRFVDIERSGLKQSCICRYLLPGIQNQDVAHYYIPLRNLRGIAVANHLDGLIVIYLVENLELILSALLEIKRKACGKDYRHKYPYRLEKHCRTLVKPYILINGNQHREHSGHHKHYDKRVLKFIQKQFPK